MSKPKKNEEAVLPSDLSAGAVYRVEVCVGGVIVSWESMLSGVRECDSALEFLFENGTSLKGSGREIAFSVRFYRKIW